MQKSGNRRISFSTNFEKIRQNLFFLLLEPEISGNIGATARALKTCGFKNLILINPKIDKEQPETLWMAHQSEDILENAEVISTFKEAINDKRLVIGTTQRKRHFKFPFYTPEEISEKIQEVALKHPVAIVFGRERTGLTNKELLQCHIHSTILTATSKPSLNLAQSVMIYAHTFFKQQNLKKIRYTYDLASQFELEKFYEHLQLSMETVEFEPRDSMDDFMTRFKRLLGRSLAEKRDIRLLHKMLQIFETRIKMLEKELPVEKIKGKKIY
jgi:tRNA (cytidine32/uridine32-2'-O)-methyltransferase